MKNLRIKIKISDREYSLNTVAENEAVLRKAGQILNKKLKLRKQQFGIHDKQDLFAIIAFDNIVNNLQREKDDVVLSSKLVELNELVDSVLE